MTDTTQGLIADLAATAATPFGLYVAASDEPLADHARRLEAEVFFETFGNTAEMLAEEYGPYEDVSMFLVVIDHHRAAVAGTIRMILDGHGSLKSMTDIEGEPWSTPLSIAIERAGLEDLDTTETLDVTTVAVHPDYRGAATNGLVSLALYQAVVRTARAGGFRWLVTILDVVVLDLINSSTTHPFHAYPGVEPKRYLDSPSSVPVWCDFEEYEPRIRARDPQMAATLFDAVGLESAVSPADDRRAGEIALSMTSGAVLDLREPASPRQPADRSDR